MNYENLVNEIFYELQKRLKNNENKKEKLVVVGNFNEIDFESIKNVCEVIKYNENIAIDEYKNILIPVLSLDMLGNIASGCSGCNYEGFILKSLMEGKNVYILESGLVYKNYKKTAYKAIYNLYSEYENKLIQYGIKIIANIMDIFNTEVCEVSLGTKEESFIDKNLLMESDLMKRHIKEYSVIKINKKCIITPLAEDYVKGHNLIVKRL